ncbi:alkaline protease secretion protein AprF [Geobacter sp. OR-1]|uniref:TolC family protein n=1 Tax=Geobacter sp. OR-1 TaxID=1266765 RepID=UPI000542FCF2|nr:TolC family protein [Geobacter sp. OR-1]GAM09877.1 alkaline protease secretion protein AprF [Geobacter sp. OR-1]
MLLAKPLYAVEPRILTLEGAVDIALKQNRDLLRAREYANYVQGRYVEERAAALPHFSIDASATVARDDSTRLLAPTDRQYSRVMDLSVSQALFTWGKIGAAIRAAEVGLKTADDQLRLYRQAAQRDVSVAFYDVLLAKELGRLAQQNLEQKKRLQDEAHKRFSAGVATDYDVLAADVAVENARPEVIRTENAVRTARDRLRFLLALDSEDIDVTGKLEAPPMKAETYETAFAAAEQHRPELADIRHRVGIYGELVTIAAAENKPRLDLKAGAGLHYLDTYGRDENGAAWNLGVYLSFPFFDGLKTSGKVQQARSDLRTKEIEAAKLRDSIALETRNALNGVREASEIVSALSGTVRQAERLLQMAEKGYEYGVKIRLEVDDAQLNLLQAQSNLARAQRDYLSSLVNLQWTMGILGE